MKTITLCLLTAAQLLAAAQSAQTSAHLQYEYLDFSGSRQKEDGARATLYVGHCIAELTKNRKKSGQNLKNSAIKTHPVLLFHTLWTTPITP